MLNATQIVELDTFKKNIEQKENQCFVDEVKKFYETYQTAKENGVKVNVVFERNFRKVEDGFITELKDIATDGIRKSVEWHQRELDNYIDEMISILEQ